MFPLYVSHVHHVTRRFAFHVVDSISSATVAKAYSIRECVAVARISHFRVSPARQSCGIVPGAHERHQIPYDPQQRISERHRSREAVDSTPGPAQLDGSGTISWPSWLTARYA